MIRREKFCKILLEAFERKEKNRDASQPAYIQNEFMTKLFLNKDKFELDHIKHQIMSVVGAGYETSGGATALCILNLALHPEIQEKAYEEIMTVFPSADTPVDSSSLAQLEFLERIIKESLRLAPAAPTIGREALDDFEIAQGEVCEKGTIFVIDILGLHRRTYLWGDDANEFKPDRFLPENFEGKQQFYMPFSAGKRNCIGSKYAAVSFKITMLKLLRKFKFSSRLKFDEIKFNRQIALKKIGPYSVSLEKRHNG